MATLNSDDTEVIRALVEELKVFKDLVQPLASAFELLAEGGKNAAEERKKENELAKKAAEDAEKIRREGLTNDQRQLEDEKRLAAEEIAAKAKKRAADDAYDKEVEAIQNGTTTSQQDYLNRQIKYQLAEYGFQKDSRDKLQKISNSREQVETKLIDQLQKQLDESPDLQKKYGTDARAYKLALDQEKLYKQQLASMGRTINEYGKLIDSTVKLNKEQENSLRKIKQETQSREESKKAVEEFNDMLGKKGAMAAGGFALTTAFEFLKAGVVGNYKGLIAYEDALLDGVRGQSVMAAMISEQQNAYADALDKTGGSLVSFGSQLVTQAYQMALTNVPMALLAVAIAGLLAVLGYASQAEAAIIKRNAELNKKRAALEDEAYKHFLELGEASMTGARGVTGMIDDLKKVGLSIKEFEKLNKILSANSKEIAMFGATTVGGAEKFIEATGSLLNSEMSKTFEKMGISQDAQMAHAEKYMAQQSRFGLLQGKTTQDVVKGMQEYIKELDRTAALLGASRKEQEQAREAVRAIQNLAAATMKAKLDGNKDLAEELLAAQKTAEKFQVEGLTTQAKAFAELAASRVINGGQVAALSNDSAQALASMPEAIEMLNSGQKDSMKMFTTAVGELTKFARPLLDAGIAGSNLSAFGLGAIEKLSDTGTKLESVFAEERKFKADPKNKGKEFDVNAFLDGLRKPATDARTTSDMELYRKTQQEALDKQTQLLNGQLGAGHQMETAANTFMDGVIKFMKAVLEFSKHPIDSMKEALTGKDKSQRDSENLKEKEQELKDTEERIRSLKESTANPEKAKKLADENLKLAEEEYKLKDAALAEMKKKMAPGYYWKPGTTEEEKRLQAKEREKLAIQSAALFKEEQAAKEKLNLAKKAVDDNDTGLFSKSVDTKKRELAALEKKKENLVTEKVALEQQVKTNPASQTQAAFDKTYGKTPGTPQSGNDLASARNKRQGAPAVAPSTTAEDAPEMAEGGVVPGSAKGTTVTVGEKGSPEAIMPLDVLKNMMGNGGGNEDQRYAQILKLNTNFSGSIDISSKTVEVGKIGNELSKDNNKLLETQTKTSDKLIISMNKVTDMLPNTLSQILSAISSSSGGAAGGAPAGAPSGAGGGVPIPQPSTSGGMIKAGTDMLKKIGLIFSPGRDLQKDNGDIDPKLIDIAKKVQETIPGFSQFTGFNDVYHTENTPKSQHTKGKAFDFSLNKTPSKEEGDKIKSQLKALGLDLVKDEYNDTSGAFRTGGHFHGQLNAYDGGVFEPRPGGVHVNLAEAGLREAAVPLNPGEKIRVEKSEQDANAPTKSPLSTVLANDTASSNSNQSSEILSALHDLMETKFDSMISAIKDGNDISDKLLMNSRI